MDALKAIEKRSSTRKYAEEKLTKEELDAIIKAGLEAPTATNRQEIHFSVLSGSDPILSEIQSDLTGKAMKTPDNFYYSAPIVVVLSGETAFHWTAVDAGIAVENMAIAAEALGLGSLIIGCIRQVLTGEKSGYYAEKLKFPEGYGYQIAIAVGKKAVDKVPHSYDYENSVSMI